MRRFNLVRNEDESGVSGTGIVAQGVEFDDGQCAMVWVTALKGYPQAYPHITRLVEIHGHGGKTVIEWIDTVNV